MVNQQQVMGNWREIKGAVKERWGQLTDQELTEAAGSRDKLIGLIQRKTGETKAAIERFLDEVGPAAASMVEQVAQTAREYAEAAGEQVGQAYDQVAERVQQGYAAAEERVRANPLQSVGVAFAAGVLTGVILGVVLRSR
jgi:uncharacterized protein YjbJ (UPF0337 family)